MTYDLREDYLAQGFSEMETAEFDSAATIGAIAGAIAVNGHEVDRIGNIRALVHALANGRRWDLVFNVCEGVAGPSREAQVPTLLEAYEIPCTFASSDALFLNMDKVLSKDLFLRNGIPTPRWHIFTHETDILGGTFDFPLFVKPVLEGSSKGISAQSLVRDLRELKTVVRELLHEFRQPVLAEAFLPGREFTVGLVGTGKNARVIGVLEVDLSKLPDKTCRSYLNKAVDWTIPQAYRLAADAVAQAAARLALDAWLVAGGRDAGRVDLRCDVDGLPMVLEVNPLAGLDPAKSDLTILAALAGMPYARLIGAIIEEASSRCRLNGLHSQNPGVFQPLVAGLDG